MDIDAYGTQFNASSADFLKSCADDRAMKTKLDVQTNWSYPSFLGGQVHTKRK